MAGGSKPSLFGRIARVVGDVAGDQEVKLPASVRGHVRVDALRERFFFSHEMFTAAVRAAAGLPGSALATRVLLSIPSPWLRIAL